MVKHYSKAIDWWKNLRTSWFLFFNKQVPWFYKLIPLAAILYLIYPFDFLNDLVPFLGQLDDLTIIGGALAIFTRLAKQAKNIKP